MFKKLRIQFVAIIMTSVAVVLAIVFTGICVSEYQRNTRDVEEALSSSIDRAVEDNQRTQDSFGFGSGLGFGLESGLDMLDRLLGLDDTSDDEATGSGSSEGETASEDESAAQTTSDSDAAATRKARVRDDGDSSTDFSGPRIGGRGGARMNMPIAVYSLTSTNMFVLASRFTTAFIDEEVLQSAASQLSAAPDGNGTLADLGLHYLKRTANGTTFVAFADTSMTDSWKSLAATLAVAGLGTLLVFLVIALALSNWALKPVKEAWDSQRQFVADASHDLKTPLTVILANSSILLKHPERTIASQSQWIESTQVEANQMQGLINEMLELAQVESAPQAQAEHEPVDFSDVVNGETLLFDSMALERNCLFECEIDDGIRVSGNAQQLKKMVGTLVENAFKYVDENGSIDVKLARSGKDAVMSVRNTGSVIAPEDLPHIFDRFYRTDKARTSGAGGFGLGLAIARETARAHGGDISCASTVADGTTFTVTLPIA